MMISELFLLLAIFSLCIFLAYEDLRSAFIFILLVSPLLHKEVFSLVRWDVLPIRLALLAVMVTCFIKFLLWLKKKKDYDQVKKYVRDPMLILLGILWFVRLISFINSKNLGASVLIFSFFSTMVFLYILLSYLARRYGEKFILSSIKFYSFIAFGTALIALLQFVLDRYYGIIFGALWRIPGKLSRVGSVFWDVNHYAGYISSMIPIVIALFLSSNSRISKVIYGFITIFMTAILLLTNSRSAWIGFAVSLLVMGTYFFVQKYGIKKIGYVVLVAVIISIPVFLEYQDRDSAFRERIKNYLHYRGDSFASHFLLLEGAVAVFNAHPIIGGGYGSFFEHFKESGVAAAYFGRDPAALSVRVPAHSIWGEVISETGILGFTVFVLLVSFLAGTIFYAGYKTQDKSKKVILIALASSAVGYFSSGIFYSYNAEFFFIVLFLGFVYARTVLGEEYSLENTFSYITGSVYYPMILIFLVSSLLIFSGLGSNHLIPWDEAIYAKVSKNMVLSNDYLFPFWDDDDNPWMEKPPLYMWVSAMFMNLMGFNSLSVKLPSALFGLGTVLMVFLFARKMFDTATGLLAAFILLTTVHFLHYSRVGMLDVTLTFFITAAMYFYYLSTVHKNKNLFFALCGAFCGFAVMTKGFAGLLTLALVGAAEIYMILAVEKDFRKMFSIPTIKKYAMFALAFLLVSLPWHYAMYSKYNDEFIETYFGYHVFKRATESIEDKGQPFYWFVTVLRTSMRIWFIGLLLNLVGFVGAVFIKPIRLILRINSNSALLYIWSFLILIFFSASISKLIWYIIPIYPFLSIIVANGAVSLFEFLQTKTHLKNYNFSKFAFALILSFFGLYYLSVVRGMVYVPDFTGSAGRLVALKDKTVGADTPLYYDRIEKPIALFYSNGKVIPVDFNPLSDEINDANFNERIVYITSDNRYEKLSLRFPNTLLLGADESLVLAMVRSDEEVINERISSIEKEIEWIMAESASGNAEAIQRVPSLPDLKRELGNLRTQYNLEIEKLRSGN